MKAAWGEGASQTHAIDWDMTVIYYGQDVVTDTTQSFLGKVSDARFDISTGKVSTLQVSDGLSSDVIQGKRSFSGDLVKRFDLDKLALVVDEAAKEVSFEGGAKEFAAETTEKVVETTVKGAAVATVYAQEGFKAALKSDAAKKTGSFFKKMASDFKEAFDEASSED